MGTVCALFMFPLLFAVYVKSIFLTLLTIAVPVFIGMLIRRSNTRRKIGKLFVHEWIERAGSALGAIMLVAALFLAIRAEPDLMDPSEYPREWIIAALFQPFGCTFGYAIARLCGLDRSDARAICLETGVQSGPMILAVTALSFNGCTRRRIEAPVYILAVWYVISSAWVIIFIRYFLSDKGHSPTSQDSRKQPAVITS